MLAQWQCFGLMSYGGSSHLGRRWTAIKEVHIIEIDPKCHILHDVVNLYSIINMVFPLEHSYGHYNWIKTVHQPVTSRPFGLVRHSDEYYTEIRPIFEHWSTVDLGASY